MLFTGYKRFLCWMISTHHHGQSSNFSRIVPPVVLESVFKNEVCFSVSRLGTFPLWKFKGIIIELWEYDFFFLLLQNTSLGFSPICLLLFIGVPEWKQGKNISHAVTHLLKGGLYFVDFLFQRWCSLLWKGLSGSFWSQVWSMSPVHYWESPRGTCFVRWSLRIGPHLIMFSWSRKKIKNSHGKILLLILEQRC